jgi:catechol 2,3-dioxygenase-like lactoylglutathione lyase family enzyme
MDDREVNLTLPGCVAGRLPSAMMAVVGEMITPILRASDAEASAAWYARLGFSRDWEHRFEPGLPLFLSISRGPMRIFLSEHQGDARPDTLLYLSVDDIEAVAMEFGLTLEQAPWGPELELRDPDGNRLRFGTTRD